MAAPAIVVNAYNRPGSLERLLGSLIRADVPNGVRLLISIDGGGDPGVHRVADGFEWPFGIKTIQAHEQNLGLVEHFIYCGGLTRELGDIIYLEDDLVVSRQFFNYTVGSLAAYRDDDRIGGISLNRLAINGYTLHRFEPLPDGGDVFFARIPWYQGQVYTPAMWERFSNWWRSSRRPVTPEDGLHPLFLPHPRWKNDFFPDTMLYLQDTDRFFVFPRASHTTQFGDPGTHFDHRTQVYQVPLQHHPAPYRFTTLSESQAVYDSFLEILPDRLAPALPGYSFDVDLNGTKPRTALKKPFTLTIRPVRNAAAAFGLEMRPPELNVIDAVPGKAISLAPTEKLRFDRMAALATAARLDRYFNPNRPGLLRDLVYRLVRAGDKGSQ